MTEREKELFDALKDQNELVAKLQDIIGHTSLHIDEHYVVTQLTTEEKEIWADAVEVWQLRLHADEPDVLKELEPYDRWWRDA